MITLAGLKTTLHNLERRGSPARPHGIVTRGFHWLAGILLIYGLVFNAEFEVLSDPAALAREVNFALVLGGTFLVRLIWVELVGGGSRLTPDAPPWERVLSRAVHYGIYMLVIAIVLTGLGIASTVSPAPTLFRLRLAFLAGGAPQEFLLELHEAFATALMLLIGLHVLGASWHWIVRKDGVWESMLRGSSRRELQ